MRTLKVLVDPYATLKPLSRHGFLGLYKSGSLF